MKIAIALLPLVAAEPWWNGAPDCVTSCLSSAWSSTAWPPAAASFCATGLPDVQSCFASGCSGSGSPSAFSSLSQSFCSAYASCTAASAAAGTTGKFVVTVAATSAQPTGTASDISLPSNMSIPSGVVISTAVAGVGRDTAALRPAAYKYTVSDCLWENIAGWGGGGFGWGGGGGGSEGSGYDGNFWNSVCPGWTYATATATLATTFTTSGTLLVTATVLATIEQAVSGTQTRATTRWKGAKAGSGTGVAIAAGTDMAISSSARQAESGPWAVVMSMVLLAAAML